MKNRIKELRNKYGMTLGEISELTGINVSDISRYENGKHTPSPENWGKLAECFDVSVPYLQGHKASNKRPTNIVMKNRIKQARTRDWDQYYTQQELAIAIAVPAYRVGLWERNQLEPSIADWIRISDVLGVSVPYLMGFDSYVAQKFSAEVLELEDLE